VVNHYKKLRFTNLAQVIKEWLAEKELEPEADKKRDSSAD